MSSEYFGKRTESVLHLTLKQDLLDGFRVAGLDAEPEYRITLPIKYWDSDRFRWARPDVAIPSMKIAIEVDVSRPSSSSLGERDEALRSLGWCLIRLEVWRWEKGERPIPQPEQRLLEQLMNG